MYATAHVPRRRLDSLRSLVGEEEIARLSDLALLMRGVRVLNLSVNPFGSSVAELLFAVVPLLRDLGIDAEWQFISDNSGLNQAAQKMHDGLRGRGVRWDSKSVSEWLLYNRLNARDIDGSYDIVVVHEPQLTALLPILRASWRELGASHWIWHCHLDLRQARAEVWESLHPILRHYDACVFSHQTFVPPGMDLGRVCVIPPAIDPSNARNVELSASSASRHLLEQGIDPSRPLILQVAPFARPFGPTEAIDVVKRAWAELPDLQLLLIQPTIDPTLEAQTEFEEVVRYAAGDPSVRVLAARGTSGSRLINAAQRVASVVLQCAAPAGFSLPLWEAMWKGRPVVAGTSGGLPLQVEPDVTGLLAEGESGLVHAMVSLLRDQDTAIRLGANAREKVRSRLLLTRFLENELRLLRAVLAGALVAAQRTAAVKP